MVLSNYSTYNDVTVEGTTDYTVDWWVEPVWLQEAQSRVKPQTKQCFRLLIVERLFRRPHDTLCYSVVHIWGLYIECVFPCCCCCCCCCCWLSQILLLLVWRPCMWNTDSPDTSDTQEEQLVAVKPEISCCVCATTNSLLLYFLFTLKSISVILLVLARFVFRVLAKPRIDMFLVVEEHNPSEWSPCSSESVSTSGCISRHNEALCSSIMACSS